MEPKKQRESKEGAAGSRTATGRKTGNEASASPTQGTSPNPTPSTSPNQGTQSNQTGAGQNMNPGQNMNQGATSQNINRGGTGQNAGDQDLLQHAKHATGEIVNQVQQRAGSQLAQQKESAATDLSHVVEAVRRFGQSLTREESGPIARYAAEYGDKAANSLERFSTYIREQDPKQLLNDVQNFGRRRPALLLGGAFLLGFAGARLIKSSMDSQSQQSFQRDVLDVRPSTSPNAL